MTGFSLCAIACALAAAMGRPAAAESWEFTFSRQTLTPEEPSTTVTLWAKFAPTDYALSGALVEVHATEPQWSDLFASLSSVMPGQVAGDVSPDGRAVTGIRVGQLWDFGYEPNPANPLAVWEATLSVTDFSTQREIVISTETDRYEVFFDLGGRFERVPRTPIDIEAAIRVIPAPAPLALLALAGLATTRRCRRP